MKILLDSNILLDIFTKDKKWFEWSYSTLEKYMHNSYIAINPIVYSEISIKFDKIEGLQQVLPDFIIKEEIPYEAAFLAGKCFIKYKKNGGTRKSTLPDFYIGAHASVRKMTLITRNKSDYKHYFPKLKIISP